MKKKLFKAADTRTAIQMIQETFGPDAVIFYNHKTASGVEICAGIVEEENTEPVSNTVPHVMLDNIESKQQVLLQQLADLGLDSTIAMRLIRQVDTSGSLIETWEALKSLLLKQLPIPKQEPILCQNTMALLGTTGVGKSVTLAKLATRFVATHDASQLGLISLDNQHVASRQQLYLYAQLLGVEARHATSKTELQRSLENFQHKQLVLIDTPGISQRDDAAIKQLKKLLQLEGGMINTCLVLPANVQPALLEETIKNFNALHLENCLISKTDESMQLAPVVSLAMKYHLPIAYLTTGQHIPDDLEVANKHMLANAVFVDLYKKLTSEQQLREVIA
jgi:flagellar biosynthesis protein FlhF